MRHCRRERAGFTLVELMIGVLIGAVTVVVAAHVAQMLVRNSAKGRQTTDFNSRTNILGKQLRADIRIAGMGSTGAITANPGAQPWASILNPAPTGFGYRALPAVSGVDSAGPPALPGSDAIQLVIPNPAVRAVTLLDSPAAGGVLNMDPAANLAQFNGCSFLYIVDHTTPSGTGRTQIANFQGTGASTLLTTDALLFNVQPQSEVMCARVSTYWVDATGWLRRTDLQPNQAPNAIGNANQPVFLGAAPAGNTDMIAGGVLDLQIAYGFGSELFRLAGQALPGLPNDRWAFNNLVGTAQALLNDPAAWFEVRMVRFNILAKKMRAVEDRNDVINEQRRENGPGTIPIEVGLTPEWVTTTEALTNLRFFDMAMPQGVAVEPI